MAGSSNQTTIYPSKNMVQSNTLMKILNQRKVMAMDTEGDNRLKILQIPTDQSNFLTSH